MALQHTINGVKRRRKQRRKEKMDNLLIVMFGLIVFIAALLVGELLAKYYDWD